MSHQIAVRIPDEIVNGLRRLVDDGIYPTMADAIREGARRLVDEQRRRDIDEAILEGYRRIPPTADEQSWADRAGSELIAEEPW
jgi:Arc/MetJ-type ribon-helix-helix transcriptional regulator